MSKNTEVIDIT